ncbi:ion transporter [Maribacter algarum]|uniref:ion transporter n=1 Tax=Maribacter algarum (ex Zhang et al. 2020) TaxID=2578118 RepID=UPI001EE505C2|nr:ion transporter [Maribacter algarum]
MKKQFYNILHSVLVTKFIYGLILINVVALVLETNQELRVDYNSSFEFIEYFSIGIFTMEYLLRIWTADSHNDIKGIFNSKRAGYIFSFYGLVDMIAILPFFLPLIIPFDLRIMRILRLFRLFRILKLGRYSSSFNGIKNVLKETKPQLVITIFIASILLLLSSTLMFYAENEAQPEKFSSISDSLWWAVATLTTVGYGDVYPVTSLGKFLSAFIALIGIGFIALPTGILSSAFIDNLKPMDDSIKRACPHCGKR